MRTLTRNLFLFLVVVACFALVVTAIAWAVRPTLTKEPSPYTAADLERAARVRDVSFDPKRTSSLHRKTIVAHTGQSPILRDLEAQKLIPPLAERVPVEPVVLAGVDGIGKYGGTWMRLANAPNDVGIITGRMSGALFVRWSPLGYPLEPHVAKAIEPSEDRKIWTITLRRGMKWSDGHPFSADDIMYWWNEEASCTLLNSNPPDFMRAGKTFGRVEKVDDRRVRFIFDEPYPLFMEALTQAIAPLDTPAHYRRQFHPDPNIGNVDLIKRTMAAYKLPSPVALYRFIGGWDNPEHPRLWPWIYRSYSSNAPHVFVRNPYYFVLDEAGNQLPYIDRLQFDIQDSKMLALTAAGGGVSMQERHIRFSDYTELMSRRDVAGTEIYQWYSAIRSVYTVNPNLNRRVDPAEPATKWKAQLLADKRFRQALSLAIDRKQIIRADYNNVGEPSQVAPGPQSPFDYPGLQTAFTQHDPQRAATLLDELGLTQRDGEGYRTFPDGSRMSFNLDFTAFTGVGPAQFMVDDWGTVGLRVILRERTRPLFYSEKDGMNFDLNVWTSESDMFPLIYPRMVVPADTESFYAVGWARWYRFGGLWGDPRSKQKGAVPVSADHPMHEAMVLYDKARQSTAIEDQKRLMNRIFEIAAENVWNISIATPPPQLVVVKKNMRNVPRNALNGNGFLTPANAGLETYFFENAKDSAGAIADTKSAILKATPRPGSLSAKGAKISAGMIVQWAFIGVGGLLILMLAVRHPFIGRRLLIMVPTMLVISVIVFVIIQLPPGDFLTTRIVQLQETGDSTAEQQVNDLKQLFRFEDPIWKQYTRWMGINWFFTYAPGDLGLLQGNMGRSMESSQPVNDILGDRLLLTILISLGTIVFTWITALPIGIYSAVRQYSVGDHILTLIGFVGMCVPAFLLALVLMAVSGVSGLFSPEFAAQPEWNWPKVVDLMKHMWIPIVVLGVGGTAGMIRVMRANLLDELKKPYVTTAMAKGVKPRKLLMKYPVRLALNPFISGIGGLFPQLVSGGAIVSMVLALPTVGPLLLTALFAEDMYLAGSMLVILSLLGIIGTLVSDLLLLWLDPRIRLQGGTR